MNEICGDNRFEIIAKAKADLLEGTNIETDEAEMAVIDNILFRCWQMGWLDRYDRKTEPRKEQNFCGKCRYLYRDFKYGLSCYRLMDNEPCKYEERKTEPTTEDWQDWKDRMWAEAIVTEPTTEDCSTVPTSSILEQVDEPKTQTKTQNSNLTFEKADERKCIDCNFLTYMFGKTWCNIKCENPHDKVCDRFKPKDEPQPFDKPTKCLGCLYSDLDKAFHPCASCVDFGKYVGEVSGKDEPQK